jgi:hypothetical protein
MLGLAKEHTAMEIIITYSSCDGCRDRRVFKTVNAARRFAHKWVGAHPEIGSTYAISGDGVGKITVYGISLADLFPEE